MNKWIPLGLLQNGFSENIRIKISLALSKPLIKTYRIKKGKHRVRKFNRCQYRVTVSPNVGDGSESVSLLKSEFMLFQSILSPSDRPIIPTHLLCQK